MKKEFGKHVRKKKETKAKKIKGVKFVKKES